MITSNFPSTSSSGSIPTGVIVMWSGATTTIPSGWALCNGQNGTPNLVDRFIVGAGSAYSVGATGGSANVTLTTAQMPSHKHSVSATTGEDGGHTHKMHYNYGTMTGASSYHDSLTGNQLGSDNDSSTSVYIDTDASSTSKAGIHTHTITITESSIGSGSSHENRPPYYALAYIMKL